MSTKIEKKSNWVRVTGSDGGYIESQSVEANLMFAILEQLKSLKKEEARDEK